MRWAGIVPGGMELDEAQWSGVGLPQAGLSEAMKTLRSVVGLVNCGHTRVKRGPQQG